jgi:hypothetical protein
VDGKRPDDRGELSDEATKGRRRTLRARAQVVRPILAPPARMPAERRPLHPRGGGTTPPGVRARGPDGAAMNSRQRPDFVNRAGRIAGGRIGTSNQPCSSRRTRRRSTTRPIAPRSRAPASPHDRLRRQGCRRSTRGLRENPSSQHGHQRPSPTKHAIALQCPVPQPKHDSHACGNIIHEKSGRKELSTHVFDSRNAARAAQG